jgi:hypothetical protein
MPTIEPARSVKHGPLDGHPRGRVRAEVRQTLAFAIDDDRLRLMNAAREMAEARAIQRAQQLSDELIIAQAAAMAITEKKVVSYFDRIRTVQAPDNACPADERMRLGSRGVRDIIGEPTVGGAAAGVHGSGAGARP